VLDLARKHLPPDSARLWLRSPNPELSYNKPIDLIGDGEYHQVVGALLAMAEGVTA